MKLALHNYAIIVISDTTQKPGCNSASCWVIF